MSFYGSVADGGKINLTFDKIYPNRSVMDSNASIDNVFVGRFVLVEYDDNTFAYRPGYIRPGEEDKTENITLYADSTCTKVYCATNTETAYGYPMHEGDVVVVESGLDPVSLTKKFYLCVGFDVQNNNFAIFERMTENGPNKYDSKDYILNYNIDKRAYRDTFKNGWDSTIWQKTVFNGMQTYKKIGSLNSQMPNFRVEAEAPTIDGPVAPHFDTRSTNTDYTFHLQPTWGLRVKKANTDDGALSDVTLDTEYSYYNPTTSEKEVLNSYPADIYYNQISLSADLEDIKERHFIDITEDIKDEITIQPTGISGTKYWSHESETIQPSEDMQEISIHLPSLGNAACRTWDMLYGDYDSEGNINSIRNTDVNWGSTEGTRMFKRKPNGTGYDFLPQKSASVAGIINSVHDLMGMIVYDNYDTRTYDENGQIILDADGNPVIDQDKVYEYLWDADPNSIYYGWLDESGKSKFFIKERDYNFIPIAEENLTELNDLKEYRELEQFVPDIYYIKRSENYLCEDGDTPTSDSRRYLLDYEIKELQSWIQSPTDINGNVLEMHYYKDNPEYDYLKDNNNIATANRLYYTLDIKQVTCLEGEEESLEGPTRIYNSKETKTMKIEDLVFPDGTIMKDSKVYSGYLYFRKDEEGKYTGSVGELVPHKIIDGELQFEMDDWGENEIPVFDYEAASLTPIENADYFYVSNYLLSYIQSASGEEGVLRPCDIQGRPYGMIIDGNMILPGNNGIKINFIPFKENTYYYSANKDTDKGFKLLNNQNEIKHNVAYFEIKETVENDVIPYYIKNTYYYKLYKDFIWGIEDQMVEDVDYCVVIPTTYNKRFYYSNYYYYDLQIPIVNDAGQTISTEIVSIIDTSETMKKIGDSVEYNSVIGTVLGNANNLVYYLKPTIYVMKDSAGILSRGSIWNTPINNIEDLPIGLQLGFLYDGEPEDFFGNPINFTPAEIVQHLYKWKELQGFADSYNTINGLIVSMNQILKQGDRVTRDTNTLQGCLNIVGDLIRDFGTFSPGQTVIVDNYGRLKGASLTDFELFAAMQTKINQLEARIAALES